MYQAGGDLGPVEPFEPVGVGMEVRPEQFPGRRRRRDAVVVQCAGMAATSVRRELCAPPLQLNPKRPLPESVAISSQSVVPWARQVA